jgi:glycosyltransferase involved in cell wall biosynthesis
MRIVSIVAGAGGMYCGTCLHASTLVAALRRAGEDALLVPAYTPVRDEEEDHVATGRVVFGGLNVYLQEKSALARHSPWFLDRLLDHPALLRWLGRRGGSTRPESLGPLCVSMLQGEEGRHRKELRKLLDWMQRELRPEVMHLSTTLLVGMARQITRSLGVPVVSTLSGEDSFVDRLPEPYASQARAVLRERCRELAALVALNRYYADFMAKYLTVPRERIHVVSPGLNLAGHRTPSQAPELAAEAGPPAGPTIGFLARICPDKGLHVLAEAFALMAGDSQLPPARLVAAGYLADADRQYLAQIRSSLAARGLADRFEYRGCLERREKIAFLQSLDVMCLPTVLPEPKGLPAIEAWANGVPVVASDHGAFPELVGDTGGGLLVEPGNVPALADALRELIRDPGRAAQLGRRGQAAVYSRYHADRMAQDTIALYRRVLGQVTA